MLLTVLPFCYCFGHFKTVMRLLQNSAFIFAYARCSQMVCFSIREFSGDTFCSSPVISLLFNSLLNLFFSDYPWGELQCSACCVLVAQSYSLMSCLLSLLINRHALNICLLYLQSQCHFLLLLSYVCPSQYIFIFYSFVKQRSFMSHLLK